MQTTLPMRSLRLSPAQAAQHLLNRRRARTDSIEFAGYIEVPARPLSDDPETELFSPIETNLATHHKLILDAMERTAQRRYGRLLLMLPPGSAKTTYASIVFPSYYMGRFPGSRLALGSYGSDIALKMGRKTRSIIRQQRYNAIFATELSKDSRAGNQFSLTNGSEYMADSLGGQFPGNRFDGAIADDPIKGRLEANSQVVRDSTWDEFRDNFVTRLVPGGWLTVIMTHWDADDPAGRILPDGWDGDSGVFKGRHDGLDWEVLCLQARCENHTDPLHRALGEYLWPEWFDREHWAQFERDARAWNSLFQQRPRAPEGAFFMRASFLVDGPPPDGKPGRMPVEMPRPVVCVFAVIDTAIKTGKEHDGTGVVFNGLMPNDFGGGYKQVILDWDYVQIEGGSLEQWLPSIFERLEELARDCSALMGSMGAWIEDKGSGMVLLQRADSHGWPAHAIDSKLSSMGKVERAFNAEPYISAGDVKISRPAYEKVVTFKGSTKNHFLTQVLNFTMDSKDGASDDLLDCLCYSVALGVGNAAGF
jgi:hypothetical protein